MHLDVGWFFYALLELATLGGFEEMGCNTLRSRWWYAFIGPSGTLLDLDAFGQGGETPYA
jgi:hypothetical protein